MTDLQDLAWRPPCGCIGHRIPGVAHVAPCCAQPHIEDTQACGFCGGQPYHHTDTCPRNPIAPWETDQ